MAAKIINKKFNGKIKGNIKFLFQPAEELAGGAKQMIMDPKYPALENPHVDQCYGLHISPRQEVGIIELNPGIFSAHGYQFTVKVEGVGSHGAAPHVAKDPIFIAMQLLDNLYSIPARNINPCNKIVLTVGSIHAGTAGNVIPNECEFSGTFRSIEESDKEIVLKRIDDIVKGFGLAFGVEIELKVEGYPGIYNHKEETKKLKEVCGEIVGLENVVDLKSGLYGEDFSYFLQKRPGAFFKLGAAPVNSIKENRIISNHNPKFTFNEDCLP